MSTAVGEGPARSNDGYPPAGMRSGNIPPFPPQYPVDQAGIPPIFEEGLDSILQRVSKETGLSAATYVPHVPSPRHNPALLPAHISPPSYAQVAPSPSSYRPQEPAAFNAAKIFANGSGATVYREGQPLRTSKTAEQCSLAEVKAELRALKANYDASVSRNRTILTTHLEGIDTQIDRLRGQHQELSGEWQVVKDEIQRQLAEKDTELGQYRQHLEQDVHTRADEAQAEINQNNHTAAATMSQSDPFKTIVQSENNSFLVEQARQRELLRVQATISAMWIEINKIANGREGVEWGKLGPRITEIERQLAHLKGRKASLIEAYEDTLRAEKITYEESSKPWLRRLRELQPQAASRSRDRGNPSRRRGQQRDVPEPRAPRRGGPQSVTDPRPPRRSELTTSRGELERARGPRQDHDDRDDYRQRPDKSGRPAHTRPPKRQRRKSGESSRRYALRALGVAGAGALATWLVLTPDAGQQTDTPDTTTTSISAETLTELKEHQPLIEAALTNPAVTIDTPELGQFNMFNGQNLVDKPEDDAKAPAQPEFSNVLNAIMAASIEDGIKPDANNYTADLIPLEAELAVDAANEMGLDFSVDGSNEIETNVQIAARLFNEYAFSLFTGEDGAANRSSYDNNPEAFYVDMLREFGYTDEQKINEIVALCLDFEAGIDNSNVAAEAGLTPSAAPSAGT